MNTAGQTICLNMIVKNESPVIRRCLDSVSGIIDHWVIVDTGSSDGTQEMIRTHMADLPGVLIEQPWIDFAHNRSEALRAARGKADYVLVIDADEVLELDQGFELPELLADSYAFEMRSGGVSYYKVQLVRDSLDWSFRSVVHEYIYSERALTEARMPGLRTLRFPDGARARDPLTYRKDAVLLEGGLLKEPDNARYMFYLAQSYRDSGEPQLAIDRYQKRVAMRGWIEEVWFSLYQIAQLKKEMRAPWAEVAEAFLTAYQTKPDRAEPLYHLGLYHQAKREFALSNLYFQQALTIPYPATDQLFIEKAVYDTLLPLEAAVASFYVGDHAAAIETNNRLLANPETSPALIELIERNRRYSLDAIIPRRSQSAAPSPLRVCVDFTDPGPHLDNLVESLLHQQGVKFTAVFVDNGSKRDHAAKIPLEDPRFRLIRLGARAPWGEALRCAAQGADETDILLPIDGAHWLADGEALADLVRVFAEYDCVAVYGQYLYSDGQRGLAMPYASPVEMTQDDRPLASILPIAVRAALLAEMQEEPTPPSLLRRAGFSRARFNDRPLVVWNLGA